MLPQSLPLDQDIEDFFYTFINQNPGKGVLNNLDFNTIATRYNLQGPFREQLERAWNALQQDIQGKLKTAFEKNPSQAAFLCDKWFGYCLSLPSCFTDPNSDKQRIVNNFKKVSAGENPVTRQEALLILKRKTDIDKRRDGANKCKKNVIDGIILRDARKAVAHILCGEIFRLDPVIGDAACEMRPPFVLDMCDLILNLVDPSELPRLQDLGRQYIESWKKTEELLLATFGEEIRDGYFEVPIDVKTPSIYLCDQIFIVLNDCLSNDSSQHPEFFAFCEKVSLTIEAENFEYLGLCKTMTTTRLMIYDRLGISLGDYQIDNLPPSIRGEYKVRLGQHSTRYIRKISHNLSQQCINPVSNSLFPQLNNVITNCNVELYTDSKQVSVLPIYEGMRIITTHELNKNRPLVFVFNRMVIKNTNTPVVHNKLIGIHDLPLEMTCLSFTPIVVMYMPQNGRYIPLENVPGNLDHRPCTVYECWSVLNVDDVPVNLSDPILAGLYDPDPNKFLAAIKQCDIAHLMQLYAASHPPMGGRAKPKSTLNIPHYNFGLDGGLSCMLELHKEVLTGGDKTRAQELLDNNFVNLNNKKQELMDLEILAANEINPLKKNLDDAQAQLKIEGKKPTEITKKLVLDCQELLRKANDKWLPGIEILKNEYDFLVEKNLLIQEDIIIETGQILPLNTVAPLSCITTINLSNEYINYRRTSMSCNMLFSYSDIVNKNAPSQVVYHIKLSGNDDTEFQYRYNRSIFFRISHILPSTYAMTIDRVMNVQNNLTGYQIPRLIDITTPAKSLEDAKTYDKDSYCRDDQ